MILIISQDSFESTTNHIIDWLTYSDSQFQRINAIDLLMKASIDFLEPTLDNSYNVLWCRRLLSFNNYKELLQENELYKDINDYFKREIKHLLNFILTSLECKFSVNKDFVHKSENKLSILKSAQQEGLCIPASLIVSCKEEVIKFTRENGPIITKGISGSWSVTLNNKTFSSYTAEVNLDDLSRFSEIFVPCFIQEKLNKEYEIRTFFLNDDLYSMAIFSQDDKQTELDFRQYNHKKMNRMVPYILPLEVETKLITLMHKVGLDTASIDIVKTIEGKYVFLELNPEGQFGMVSQPCNYYLEEKMALYLTQRDRKYE